MKKYTFVFLLCITHFLYPQEGELSPYLKAFELEFPQLYTEVFSYWGEALCIDSSQKEEILFALLQKSDFGNDEGSGVALLDAIWNVFDSLKEHSYGDADIREYLHAHIMSQFSNEMTSKQENKKSKKKNSLKKRYKAFLYLFATITITATIYIIWKKKIKPKKKEAKVKPWGIKLPVPYPVKIAERVPVKISVKEEEKWWEPMLDGLLFGLKIGAALGGLGGLGGLGVAPASNFQIPSPPGVIA